MRTLNRQLTDFFGKDTITGLPIWKVVWSEDQFEKRLGTYDDITPSGIFIRTVTEVREVPKYSQWIREKFVLERLVVVPEVSQEMLPTSKISYEPIWAFDHIDGQPILPSLEAVQFIINIVYAALGKVSLHKYADPEDNQDPIEVLNDRVNKLEKELFANETEVGDALAHKSGVGYTGPTKIH